MGVALVTTSPAYAVQAASAPATVTVPITAGGPAVIAALVPNDSATFTFTGKKGQLLGVQVDKQGVVKDSDLRVAVVQMSTSNGVASEAMYNGDAQAAVNLVLPGSGSYQIQVTPYYSSSAYEGAVSAILRTPASASLKANGTPVVVGLAPSQSATLAFTGRKGQLLGVQVDKQGVVKEGDLRVVVVQMSTSNGVASEAMYNGDALGALNFVLPGSGSYQVQVTPYYTGSVYEGAVSATLRAPATTRLKANGAPVGVGLAASQSAMFTFAGRKGQRLGLRVAKQDIATEGDLRIQVVSRKAGGQIVADAMYSGDEDSALSFQLPEKGAYAVLVTPYYTGSVYQGGITASLR